MGVVATSRWAYESVDLPARQLDVIVALLAMGEATDKQIAAHLAWPINRVTPRRGELHEKGLVARARLTVDPETGRDVSVWRLEPTQQDLFGRGTP